MSKGKFTPPKTNTTPAPQVNENRDRSVNVVHLAQYQPVAATERRDNAGWLKFGDDNLYPLYLKELAETSPVHGAILKGVVKMLEGKGFATQSVIDKGVLDNLGASKSLAQAVSDLAIYEGFYIEKIKTLDRKGVSKVKVLPFEHCRLAVDELDNVLGVWYSRDWSNFRKAQYKPKFIPLKDEKGGREVVISFLDKCNSNLYPSPSYKSCINYIEIDRKISQFHVSNISNGFFAAHHLALFNGLPNPEDKQQIIRDINRNSGAENSGQMWVTFHEPGETPPQLTTLQASDLDKQFEFLWKISTQMICTGHLVTTPLNFGIRLEATGFSSNAEEMKQGLLQFIQNVIEPMQREIIETFEAATGVKGLSITPNTMFWEQATGVDPNNNQGQAENVAAQALNGAQIESLVNIIMQASAQTLPIESTKAVVAAGFPMLTTTQIDEIFTNIVPGSIPQQSVLKAAVLKAVEKKKCEHLSADDMTDEVEDEWLKYLYDKMELIDPDEYELVEEVEVGDPDHEARINNPDYLYKAYAKPDDKSKEMDAGIYKIRYQYKGKVSQNSRRFCRAMMQASSAGVVYRYEDIIRMGDEGVNSGFAAAGESTYSIFLYKGGANCHHYWTRQVYRRKRDAKGKILPNDGLNNDERISQNQAQRAGFEFRDTGEWAKAATRPIDMPNNGYKTK